MRGVVKMKNEDRGFGFLIADQDKAEHFFHCYGVSTASSFEELQPGDAVSFDLVIDARSNRLRAVNVAAA